MGNILRNLLPVGGCVPDTANQRAKFWTHPPTGNILVGDLSVLKFADSLKICRGVLCDLLLSNPRRPTFLHA